MINPASARVRRLRFAELGVVIVGSVGIQLPAAFSASGPVPESAISQAEADLGLKLPSDYRRVLAEVGGGEGPVGDAGYLILWPPEELAEANRGYKADADYADGLLLIGTDGGNEAFAVRLSDGAYVGAPLIGMSADAVQELGEDFAAFLRSFD